MLIAFAYCFPISNKAAETVSKTVELNLDALIEPEKGEFSVPVFVIAAFTVRPADVISPAKAEVPPPLDVTVPPEVKFAALKLPAKADVPVPFDVTVKLDVSQAAEMAPFDVIDATLSSNRIEPAFVPPITKVPFAV